MDLPAAADGARARIDISLFTRECVAVPVPYLLSKMRHSVLHLVWGRACFHGGLSLGQVGFKSMFGEGEKCPGVRIRS